MAKSVEQNFWSKVNTHGSYPSRQACRIHPTINGTCCWVWLGGRTSAGYGRIRYAGKDALAHRVVWILDKGFIPKNKCVLHRCDNPSCVRLSHLFLGSRFDNVYDKCLKDRQAKGITIGGVRGKISKKTVLAVRKQYATGLFSFKELSDLFKIGKSSIEFIVYRQRYAYY